MLEFLSARRRPNAKLNGYTHKTYKHIVRYIDSNRIHLSNDRPIWVITRTPICVSNNLFLLQVLDFLDARPRPNSKRRAQAAFATASFPAGATGTSSSSSRRKSGRGVSGVGGIHL